MSDEVSTQPTADDVTTADPTEEEALAPELEYTVPEAVDALCPICSTKQSVATDGKPYAEWKEGDPLTCPYCKGNYPRSDYGIADNGQWCCAWEVTVGG